MPPPTTSLTIVTKGLPLGTWVRPQATINGYPVSLTWGSNTIGIAPGVHQVDIWMPWLWRFGQAAITVDNRYDPAPAVYYATPWVNFGAGAIGFSPVRNPMLWLFLALFVLPLVLLVGCCAFANLAP
jgi:hypothetical protein